MKKTILVTGASGNLGKAVVRKLSTSGYHVLALDVTRAAEEFLNKENIAPAQLNLRDEQEVQEYIGSIKSLHGAVLTVGGFTMGDLLHTTGAQLKDMFRLNFETAYFMVKPLLPIFTNHGSGQFVFIGARPALDPHTGMNMVAYALSKSLLFTLSDMINAYGKGKRIHSTVMVPSTIDTPANRASMPEADYSKWVTPEAIADTTEFLFSESGSQAREGVMKIYNES
jgi:NAD(P)-dependent dehydrogenase (short-subunit alcohol dehydrogenase family)